MASSRLVGLVFVYLSFLLVDYHYLSIGWVSQYDNTVHLNFVSATHFKQP